MVEIDLLLLDVHEADGAIGGVVKLRNHQSHDTEPARVAFDLTHPERRREGTGRRPSGT
jgi:hypothetical protein